MSEFGGVNPVGIVFGVGLLLALMWAFGWFEGDLK